MSNQPRGGPDHGVAGGADGSAVELAGAAQQPAADGPDHGAAPAGVARAGGRLRAAGIFAYDFFIGDDWLVAAVICAGLGAAYGLSRAAVPAWWLIPLLLVVLLPVSLWRALRGR